MEYNSENTVKSISGWNHEIKMGSNKFVLAIIMFFRGLSLLSVFGFTMSFIYAGLGVFLFFVDNIFNFSDFQQLGLGLILLAYGLFRFYTTLKKKRENELEEDDEE